MTNETYEKAEKIQKKLRDLDTLHYIACKPYKEFFFTKKFLWMSTYDKEKVCLCDDGLNELILEYCNKRRQELREELKLL